MIEGSPSNTRFAGSIALSPLGDAPLRFEHQLLEVLQQQGYSHTSIFAVRLALQEALTNAFLHGNRNDPAKRVTVEYDVDPQRIILMITDEGDGFDVNAVPDPTAEENITIASGRGIMLMRSFMSDVQYTPPGNSVRMVYQRPDDLSSGQPTES